MTPSISLKASVSPPSPPRCCTLALGACGWCLVGVGVVALLDTTVLNVLLVVLLLLPPPPLVVVVVVLVGGLARLARNAPTTPVDATTP